MRAPSWRHAMRRLMAQGESTLGDYSRFDLAIAMLLGIAIAAWLVSYVVLMVLYAMTVPRRPATVLPTDKSSRPRPAGLRLSWPRHHGQERHQGVIRYERL